MNTEPLTSHPTPEQTALIIFPGVDFMETLHTDHTWLYLLQMSKCTSICKFLFQDTEGDNRYRNVIMKSKSHKINYTITIINIQLVAKQHTSRNCIFCLNTLLYSGIHILFYKTGNSNGDIDNTFVKYNHLQFLYVYGMSVNCSAMAYPKQREERICLFGVIHFVAYNLT